MVTFISRNDSGTGAEGVRVRVLFVEDLETDAELAARRLRTDGIPLFSYRAPSARSARLKRCGAGEFLPILESSGMIMSVGEWASLSPLIVLVVALGVYPGPVLDMISPPIERIIDAVNGAGLTSFGPLW